MDGTLFSIPPSSREPQVHAALAGTGHVQVWHQATPHMSRWSPANPDDGAGGATQDLPPPGH